MRPWEIMLPQLAAYNPEKLLALGMIIACLLDGRLSLRLNVQTLSVVTFLMALYLSCINAYSTSLAYPELYKYLTLFAFHLVLLAAIRSPRELAFVLACYMIAMFLYVGKSEWEFYWHGRHSFKQGVVRMTGLDLTFGNANAFAASVILSLPIWQLLLAYRKTLVRNWPPLTQRAATVFLWAYLGMAVIAVFESKSRTGMVALIVAFSLMLIRSTSAKKRLLTVACMAALLLFAGLRMGARDWERLETLIDPTAGPAVARASAEGRIQGFKVGWAMFRDHPIFGVGLGNFIPVRIAQYDGVALNPHNLPGQLLGETGLCGVVSFLLLLFVMLAGIRGIRRTAREGPATSSSMFLSHTATACQDVILLLCVCGLSGHNLIRFQWYWLPAMIGLLAAFQSDGLFEPAEDEASVAIEPNISRETY